MERKIQGRKKGLKKARKDERKEILFSRGTADK